MVFKAVLKKTYLFLYKYGLFNWIPSKAFVEFQYHMATGKKLNLNNPQTFNEKIQWLKIYDRNPIYRTLADKYKVRSYVAQKVGEQYLIPLLGVWDSPEKIDKNVLPDQFVIKNNHDSGGVFICKNKDEFEFDKVKSLLGKRMKINHYYVSREWCYKDIERCILAEKYLIDEEVGELRDYKFFCFAGEPRYVQVDYDRFTNHKRNIYDLNWKLLDLTIKCPNDSEKKIKKPKCFDEMISIARKISENLPQLRVDLYEVNGQVYFGEATVYHGGGFEKFTPSSYENEWGELVDLKLALVGD